MTVEAEYWDCRDVPVRYDDAPTDTPDNVDFIVDPPMLDELVVGPTVANSVSFSLKILIKEEWGDVTGSGGTLKSDKLNSIKSIEL